MAKGILVMRKTAFCKCGKAIYPKYIKCYQCMIDSGDFKPRSSHQARQPESPQRTTQSTPQEIELQRRIKLGST